MAKNAAFAKKVLPLLILGVFMMYFYSGLQNDHLNVLTPYYSQFGWSANAITAPVTVAGFVVIVATLVIGTLFMKFGVVKVVVPSTIVLGLGCVGLAFAGQNYAIYSVSLFLVRLLVVPLQMGGFMLCTNWFITGRGRSLGWITIGSPLCTATLIAGLTAGVASSLGFKGTYTIVGGVVILLAVLIGLTIKNAPEECGLNPDGADKASAVAADETKSMTLKEVLANKNSWLLIISYGLLQFCIVGIMAFYVPRLQMTGTEPKLFFFWLSVAAILGIPISYFLGWIDDKFGTVIASLVLCATYVMSLCGLLFMPANSVPMLIMTAIGIAGITGGMPTLHPSITAYVYGRKNYQAANRWVMTIQAVIMAFAITFMATILDKTHGLNLAYQIMLGMIAVCVVCIVIMGRTPDYDRGNAKA